MLQLISSYMLIGMLFSMATDYLSHLSKKIDPEGTQELTTFDRLGIITLWPIFIILVTIALFRSKKS